MGRLTVVNGMAFVSYYISGWHGIWVVLKKWMAWTMDHLTVVDVMAFGSSYSSGWLALGRLRVVDGMAFGSS
jgi:hypothetical protein